MAKLIPVDLFDLVIFGGTGDLAMRKLLPALYHRHRDGQFPAGSRIIAVGRQALSQEDYLACFFVLSHFRYTCFSFFSLSVFFLLLPLLLLFLLLLFFFIFIFSSSSSFHLCFFYLTFCIVPSFY